MQHRFFKFITGILLAGFTATAMSQEFSAVSGSAKKDLDVALSELAAAQMCISEEKIPLAKKLARAEEATLARRREVEKTARDLENKIVDLNVMKSEAKARGAEIAFVSGALNEYMNAFESRTHIAEVLRYKDGIAAARADAGNADLGVFERLEKRLGMLDTALDRIDAVLGGESFEGKALTESGKLEKGTYALIGPLAAFASSESGAIGLTRLQLNTTEPSVIPAAEAFQAELKALVSGGSGVVPFDPSGGNADKIAATKESFVEHVSKGGPVVVPILVLGVLAVVIGIFKWVQIAGVRLAKPRDLQIVLDRLKDGNEEGAMNHAGSIKGPVGELMQAAVLHAGEKKEYIEEALYEKMLIAKPQLERWMPLVALAAATAPLLGLLGTVTGMINTFRLISVFGTGDPKMLSSGISEALVTTEFGLIVAIPALLIHAFISRKAKGVLGSMEQASVAFINGVPGEGGDDGDGPSKAEGGKPTPSPALEKSETVEETDEPANAAPVPA